MRFAIPIVLSLLAGTLSIALPQELTTTAIPVAASSDVDEATDQLAQLSEFAKEQVNAVLEHSKNKRGGCTLSKLSIRKEWGSLTNTQRKAYTDAVLCLQAKPPQTPTSLIPGARSRFDDWVGSHILRTPFIHYTGNFLAWHRYYIWTYEQALRNECGYTGYQPYWDWAKTAATGLDTSPIFDGSAYSMGSNGAPIAGQGNIVLQFGDLPPIVLPSGSGGGCVTSGPFKDMEVTLGPVALALTDGTTVGNGDGLSYNPRCLKRDLTRAINQRYANATSVVKLILTSPDIWQFQMTMQGNPGTDEIGVHGGGHYTIGGDPGRDAFISPGDPAFYLHHGMIDRVWWIWQMLDRETRTGADGISGTETLLNFPPSENTTMDTPVTMGYAGGPDLPMRDLMDTTKGPFCYIYL
ncbi:Di-copper centre-containing protein [Amniculicola lignicola CBS 123094]|uniref:Di-copper centre-containing protein n=1 Tax=Amniculicola lignicola CBS 123094 TaxID=1392246 RepID=A0A6A5WZS6_9PLEO|nr:Di-copper centre-containing protein [Amniculicola lignicola CBS 123094]